MARTKLNEQEKLHGAGLKVPYEAKLRYNKLPIKLKKRVLESARKAFELTVLAVYLEQETKNPEENAAKVNF